MHQGQAAFIDKFMHFLPSLVDIAMQNHFSTQRPTTLHLEAAGIFRHHNGHRYIDLSGGPGEAKGVIAR